MSQTAEAMTAVVTSGSLGPHHKLPQGCDSHGVQGHGGSTASDPTGSGVTGTGGGQAGVHEKSTVVVGTTVSTNGG